MNKIKRLGRQLRIINMYLYMAAARGTVILPTYVQPAGQLMCAHPI